MLHEDALTLMAPEKWDDPYEKALQTHYENNGALTNDMKVYGLCWSVEGRSDALWRIYSPNKLGIRVSTTVGNLIESIEFNGELDALRQRTLLGQVTYLPETTSKKYGFKWPHGPLKLGANDFTRPISTFANAIDEITRYRPTDVTHDAPWLARAFLVKRRAFKHEDEVRLLCFPDKNERKLIQNEQTQASQVIKLKTPMSKLITRIEFDPRMGDDVVEALTGFISPKLPHLKPNSMKKSSLYKIPASKGLPS